MSVYALDSNIISYILQRRLDVQRHVYRVLQNNDTIVIPPVAFYEVKRGLIANNATAKVARFDWLCNKFPIGEMNRAIWETAAEIYVPLQKKGTRIEDADVLIAAFCVAHNFVLVTNNVEHLGRIPELKWENWATEGEL